MSHFGHKNGESSQLWIHSKDFSEIQHNESGQDICYIIL